MLILWKNVEGRECAARFTIKDEALNFCDDLRTRHGATEIELIDADGVRIESPVSASQPAKIGK